MHSAILSYIYAFFLQIRTALSDSRVAALFMKVYKEISSSVTNSFAARLFIKEPKSRDKKSAIERVCRFPFWILEKIGALLQKPLIRFGEKSVFAEMGKYYFNSFAAVNVRFFGGLCVGFGFGFMLLKLAVGYFAPISIGAIVLGLVLSLIKCNISAHLGGSVISKFILSASGFSDVNLNFFDEKYTEGKKSYLSALIFGLLAGGAASFSPIIGLALPFGVFGMLLVLYFPVAGVFAALFAAPFVPTMILAALCMFSFGALFLKNAAEGKKWKTSGVGCALILLLAILFVTSVFSFDAKKSLMVWAMYMVFFSFYFVVINTVETREQMKALLKLFVISGAFVALYGVLQYIFGWRTNNSWIDESMFEEATMRAYSTLENPNVLGEYLLLVLPVAAVFMIKFEKKSLSKWVYAGMFLLLALCLVFTQSRGCWLGFLLSCAIFVSFYEGRLWALLPLGVMLLPFILPQTIVDRIMSIGNMEDSSTSYRVYIWYGTMAMLKNYWVGGIGMGEGAFSQVYPFYSYNAIIAPHSHNLFLQLTVEAGVGALIVFVSAMVIFFKDMAYTGKRAVKNSYDYLISLALASGVCGFLLQSMFDYTFYNYRVMAMFVMYLAIGGAMRKIAREDSGK